MQFLTFYPVIGRCLIFSWVSTVNTIMLQEMCLESKIALCLRNVIWCYGMRVNYYMLWKGSCRIMTRCGLFLSSSIKSDISVQYNADVCDMWMCVCVYQDAALKMRRECFASVCGPGKGRERCGGECIRSTATSSWPPTWDNPPIAHTAANSSGECTYLHRLRCSNGEKLDL